MKIKKLTLALLCACLLPSFMMAQGTKNQVERPKLVVGIIVDQMRWDYFYRLYDRYGDGGFRRLLNDGYSFENCMVDYLPTITAVGHSTVYTGSVPSIHGITGNDFIEQATGKQVYCSEDKSVKTVGLNDPENKVGKMSPLNLKAQTITDQLKFATNYRSKIIGVALKDRGSIFPAGHAADAAYWFDAKTGKWITSTFYMDKLPKWLSDYNDSNPVERYLKQDWNPSFPLDTYKSSPDPKNIGKYETGFKGYDIPPFPMPTSEMMKTLGLQLIQYTPAGNTITTDVAKLALINERLGHNPSGDTDFLAISYSAPDKMAHHYSINTVFTEDAYIKLDKELEDLFNTLDKEVGKGNYTVFLTADHAGTPNAQFSNDHNVPGGMFTYKEQLPPLNAHLKQVYGYDNMVLSFLNYQVNLNYDVINKNGLDKEQVKKTCIEHLEKQESVLYAVDMLKISESSIPEFMKNKLLKGYNRRVCGEIDIVLMPGYYNWDENSDPTKGGTHGSWSADDSHIPFVLMGWGVPHGKTSEEVYMSDITPTIASLLTIQMPAGCVGKSRAYFFGANR